MRTRFMLLMVLVPAVLTSVALLTPRARGTPPLVENTGWGCSGMTSKACRACCFTNAGKVRASCIVNGGTPEFCDDEFIDAVRDCKREECGPTVRGGVL